ncbi:MAG TPA: RluA family pseudouridine synthase [bacterium]|nr:RluA family pseudouridine synthase [bacterium]
MKLEPIHREITLRSQITAKSSQTLLEFLVSKFKYLERGEWEERITTGKVMVNDHAASPGQPLRAGDEVAYTTNAWEEPAVNTNYRVVYEDDQLLVVSKPAPLPVHAIGAYFRNTLMYLLRRDRPEARDFHLVHRLDSETSGLIALVKDPQYLKKLQTQWRTPEVRKTYRAIVFGRFPEGKKTVDAPIGPKKGSEIRMKLAVTEVEGYASVTEFELLETKGKFSLIQARPLTGRTHQIRVHLEYLGFPIVGDKLYSGNDETFLHFYENDWDDWLKERVLLPRVALHAFKLEFPHPETGQKMEFTDPLSEDLTSFWTDV